MPRTLSHPSYECEKLSKSFIDILRSTSLCSMATIAEANSHINIAYFCYDEEFTFYFLTSPVAQHSQNLMKNNSMAITIFDTDQPWGERPLKGIQLFGTCSIALDQTKARNYYSKRFGEFKKWFKSLSLKEQNDFKSVFYCFLPNKIKLFDENAFGEDNIIEILL
jgi:uncharacterized protein YhbP (UPF0306 family)